MKKTYMEVELKHDSLDKILNEGTVGKIRLTMFPELKKFLSYFGADYNAGISGHTIPRKIYDCICLPNNVNYTKFVSFEFRSVWEKEDLSKKTVLEFDTDNITEYSIAVDFCKQLLDYIKVRSEISKIDKYAKFSIEEKEVGKVISNE